MQQKKRDKYLLWLLSWGSAKQPLEKTNSIKLSTTEPPHYMSYHTYKLSQFTETPTKQTMIPDKEPKPWHYCHLFKYLEEFLNVLIQQCDFFWVPALNIRSHINADLFNSYFLSAISLGQDQIWVIIKRTISITQC